MVLLFSLISLCTLSTGTNPGILMSVPESLFTNLLTTYTSQFSKQIQSIAFPDVLIPLPLKKDLATDVLLTNIALTEFLFLVTDAKVAFNNSQEIFIVLPDLSLSSSMTWKIQSHKKKGVIQSGTALMSITKATIFIHLQLTKDLKEPFLIIESQFQVEDIHVEFEDSVMSSVLNWSVKNINQRLKDAVEKEIDSQLSTFVDSVATGPLPQRVNLTPWLILDVSLISPLAIRGSYLNLELNGTFFHVSHSDPSNLKLPLALYDSENSGFVSFISEYTLNTLSEAYFYESPVSISNTQLGIPLTTNYLNAPFPGIVDDFGADQPAKVNCTQTQRFYFFIGSGVIMNYLYLTCNLSTTLPIMKFDLEIIVDTKIRLDHGVVRGQFSSIYVSAVELKESHLRNEPDLNNFQSFLNGILVPGKIYLSGKIFGSGIAIPEEVLARFEDLKAEVSEEFLVIQSNPKFG